MLDLNKHLDFFNPNNYTDTIHLIGAGAIGSNTANQLARLGFKNIILYDFDVINSHNITNQLYTQNDIGKLKIASLSDYLVQINPELNIILKSKGWDSSSKLTGIVILALDSIKTRREIVESIMENKQVKLILDMRIGLEEAQMYFADWSDEKARKRILSTMQFDDKEVEVPVSACGTQLTVLPTVQGIVSLGVMNLLNFLKTGKYNYQTVINTILGLASSQ